jgi:hypothetical protein
LIRSHQSRLETLENTSGFLAAHSFTPIITQGILVVKFFSRNDIYKTVQFIKTVLSPGVQVATIDFSVN